MRRTSALLVCLLLGCAAPPPAAPTNTAKAPAGPTEADAKSALDAAVQEKSADALLDVFNKYRKLPSGKTALRRATRLLLEDVRAATAACDETTAKAKLARLAPFTMEDVGVDEAYDEAQRQVADSHDACTLKKLDDALAKADKDEDFAAAFQAIAATDLDAATVKQRRLSVVAKWKTWIEPAMRAIVEKKSTIDDARKAKLLGAIDPARVAPELAPELATWGPAVRAAVLVFHDLEGGALLEPPRKAWVFADTTTRALDKPDVDGSGPPMKKGDTFHAIARGKRDGAPVLLAGEAKKDVLARLQSAKSIVDESETDPKKAGKKKPSPKKPEKSSEPETLE